VVKGLAELAGGIKSENVLIGVHCCGNTDWSLFTEVSAIDIINFDAWDFLDKFVLYAQDIKKFIERGGIICWGVVPTGDYSGELTPEDMAERINRGIDALVQKGVNKNKLQESLLVSPACGLGALDARKAEGILNLLAQTSSFIKKSS
jgi:methionine synthase II (cobalamin-independent)